MNRIVGNETARALLIGAVTGLSDVRATAVLLAGCRSEPPPPSTPTPTSEKTMAAMSCFDVLRYHDAVRLQRQDKGLPIDDGVPHSEGSLAVAVDYAVLLSRLYGFNIDFLVARERVEECGPCAPHLVTTGLCFAGERRP